MDQSCNNYEEDLSKNLLKFPDNEASKENKRTPGLVAEGKLEAIQPSMQPETGDLLKQIENKYSEQEPGS
uniref:Uncharacterized protein n=1 Tax=Acrobeloides nanus TaxID=290746 RepID=A0A914D4I9_9BILA